MKSLKNLIFINPENPANESAPKADTSFPSTGEAKQNGTTFPQVATVNPNIPSECAPHMDAIMDLYEKGFTNLNQPGVDFFEFFQAVMDGGASNAGAYKMAFKMLSTMEKGLTKDSLVSQSNFYVNELTKVHTDYNNDGLKKKNELLSTKTIEEQSLKTDVTMLKEQFESIKNQIASKEMQLSQIDSKYQPKLNEIDCKLMANDSAKNRILSSINTVVTGINQNL